MPKFVDEDEIKAFFTLQPRQKLFLAIVAAINFVITLLGYMMSKEVADKGSKSPETDVEDT